MTLTKLTGITVLSNSTVKQFCLPIRSVVKFYSSGTEVSPSCLKAKVQSPNFISTFSTANINCYHLNNESVIKRLQSISSPLDNKDVALKQNYQPQNLSSSRLLYCQFIETIKL